MIAEIYFLTVALATFITFSNEKFGLALLIFIGLFSDIARKLTLGNPVYFSLGIIPIFVAIYLKKVFLKRKSLVVSFPNFRISFNLFMVFLLINFIRPILDEPLSWITASFSLTQYLALFLAVQAGFYILDDEDQVVKFIKLYLILLLPFLISSLFQSWGFAEKWPVLRTMEVDGPYIRGGSGIVVEMINGLFRNPEELGWHAMVAAIFALYMLLRDGQVLFWKLFYATVSLFSAYCVLLSARRKYFLGIVVFLIIYLVITLRRNTKKLVAHIFILFVLFGIGWIGSRNPNEASLKYYIIGKTGFETVGQRAEEGVLDSVFWAIRRDGFLGAGLGATVQGARHFVYKTARDLPGIEAGPGKIISELGVPGALILCFLLLCYLYNLLKSMVKKGSFAINLTCAIFMLAFVITQLAIFMVSHQVFADPLVSLLTGLMFGAALAIANVKKDEYA